MRVLSKLTNEIQNHPVPSVTLSSVALAMIFAGAAAFIALYKPGLHTLSKEAKVGIITGASALGYTLPLLGCIGYCGGYIVLNTVKHPSSSPPPTDDSSSDSGSHGGWRDGVPYRFDFDNSDEITRGF